MKRKIKIMLSDLTHTGENINSDHFPLGIGFIASYTLKSLKNEAEVSLHKLPEELLEKFEKSKPDFFCFSSYNWNERLSYSIASYAKKVNPKIITIFGGPNFPVQNYARQQFLSEKPNIDFYIKSDGEYAFVRLIKKLVEFNYDVKKFKDLNIILPNVCYVNDDKYIEGTYERVEDLSSIPSPYTMGLMDKFFELKLMPAIQTNRGCPYECTFCADGELSNRKIHRKSNEYMREELEYIAKKVKLSPTLAFCDLNFGMYKQDIETAKIIRDIRRKYNWPGQMYGSTGKSQPKRMAEIGKIINEGGLDIIKMGSSLQSVSPEVLKAIKRKNLSFDELRALHHDNVESQNFTEFIIPLPGETKKSFMDGLINIIDDIKFNNIAIHHLELLKGSEMDTKEQRLKYGFKSKFRIFESCFGNYKIGNKKIPISEIEEIAVATNTMTNDEYNDLRVMTLLIKIFIDGDTYKSIFEVLRRYGIKGIDILVKIQEDTCKEFPKFSKLLEDFVNAGKNKFFDSKSDLENILSNPKIAKKFFEGKFTQNELLLYRAKAHKDCSDDCTKVLKLAIKTIIDEKNLISKELDEYLREAFKFCDYRKFNFDEMNNFEADFTFDFIKGDRSGFNVDPHEIRKNVKILFYYENEKNLLKKHLKFYDNSNYYQWGKIIQKMNWVRMRKRIKYANINTIQ